MEQISGKENAPKILMTCKDVLDLYDKLESMGIKIWVDGGWGVDALLGHQTREHKDLDIAIEYRDLPKFRDYLESQGYSKVERAEDKKWNFVLGDKKGHEIDVHAFTFDENGKVVEGIEYPDGSLIGTGTIDSHAVRCIDAEHLIKFHTQYEPNEKDFKDVQALCKKFNIPLPPVFERFKK